MTGEPLSDGQGQRGLDRICRLAGLPERPWHVLRHSFATHAALFGVNPWSLQSWLGHKRIEETMIYVNYANAHRTPIPAPLLAAAAREQDPDQRILRMLAARGDLPPATDRGTQVAQTDRSDDLSKETRVVG